MRLTPHHVPVTSAERAQPRGGAPSPATPRTPATLASLPPPNRVACGADEMHTQGIEPPAGRGGHAGDAQTARSENVMTKLPAHHLPLLKARGPRGPGDPAIAAWCRWRSGWGARQGGQPAQTSTPTV